MIWRISLLLINIHLSWFLHVICSFGELLTKEKIETFNRFQVPFINLIPPPPPCIVMRVVQDHCDLFKLCRICEVWNMPGSWVVIYKLKFMSLAQAGPPYYTTTTVPSVPYNTFHFTSDFIKILFTDVDDCINVTCQHNSTCVDLVDNHECNCTAGYTGAQCETGLHNLMAWIAITIKMSYQYLQSDVSICISLFLLVWVSTNMFKPNWC